MSQQKTFPVCLECFCVNAPLRITSFVILHEDRDVLVVDKPAGLLTMGTDSKRLTVIASGF